MWVAFLYLFIGVCGGVGNKQIAMLSGIPAKNTAFLTCSVFSVSQCNAAGFACVAVKNRSGFDAQKPLHSAVRRPIACV